MGADSRPGMQEAGGYANRRIYRWRKECDGLRMYRAERLKQREGKNELLEETGSRLSSGYLDPKGSGFGKLIVPARRGQMIDRVRRMLVISMPRACRLYRFH